MRKKNRQVSDKDAFDILSRCEEITISMYDPENNEPYAVITNPVLVDKTVYIHCAHAGQKVDVIKKNPSVCLSAYTAARVIEEKFTTAYESVIAHSHAYFVIDKDEKEQVLYALCDKFTPSLSKEHIERYTKPRLDKTNIIAFPIEKITGKANRR